MNEQPEIPAPLAGCTNRDANYFNAEATANKGSCTSYVLAV